jgi:hypothetical protein
MFFTGIIMVF